MSENGTIRSKAFLGYPSNLFIDGERMAQVVSIEIGKWIEVEANFIPRCPAQQKVLEAIQSGGAVFVRLELPATAGATYEWQAEEITGSVPITCVDVCKLKFKFPAPNIRPILSSDAA